MPMTPEQFAAGANKQLEVYSTENPVDQIGHEKPFLKWLIANKKDAPGGNQYFNEKIHIAFDANYQNYYGDDQVSYNRRDTVRLAKYGWSNFHDGFGLNEDELAANGITMTDDRTAEATGAEKIQIYNLLTQNYDDLKEGVQEQFDLEMHLDGSQDPKAAQGLDFLVSTNPGAQTNVGGLNPSVAGYWRNNINMGINSATAGALLAAMDVTWRDCIRFGKKGPPDKIICGSLFHDAYKIAVRAANVVQVNLSQGASGGPSIDGATGDLYYNKVLVEWDPTFDALDELLGAITYPWKKRCYFLNSKVIKLRPLPGHWMVNRKPPRMYDRYVHYFGMTSKYRLTCNKRNSLAVLSIQ